MNTEVAPITNTQTEARPTAERGPTDPETIVQDALDLFRIRLAIHVIYAGLIRELLHCPATRTLFGNTLELLLEVLEGMRPPQADATTELDEIVRHLRTAARFLRRGGEKDSHTPDRESAVLFALAMGQCREARRKTSELLNQKAPVGSSLHSLMTRTLANRSAVDLTAEVEALSRELPDGSPLAGVAEKLARRLGTQVRNVRALFAIPLPLQSEERLVWERDLCLFTRECYLLLHLLVLADPSRVTPASVDDVYLLHREAGRRLNAGFIKTALSDRSKSLLTYFPPPFDDFRMYLAESIYQVARVVKSATPDVRQVPAGAV